MKSFDHLDCTPTSGRTSSYFQRFLVETIHRFGAVAVLLLAGGLAAAYMAKGPLGGRGAKVMSLGIVAAEAATLLALWVYWIDRRSGRRPRWALLMFGAAVLGATTAAMVADHAGWLEPVMVNLHKRFDALAEA